MRLINIIDREVQIDSFKNNHEDIKYSKGNTVSDTVMTVCGASGHWEYQGTLCKADDYLTTTLDT